MAKEFLTDAEVELEIARLLESDTVKLAKAEQRLKYRRRQYLYQLRLSKSRNARSARKPSSRRLSATERQSSRSERREHDVHDR